MDCLNLENRVQSCKCWLHWAIVKLFTMGALPFLICIAYVHHCWLHNTVLKTSTILACYFGRPPSALCPWHRVTLQITLCLTQLDIWNMNDYINNVQMHHIHVH